MRRLHLLTGLFSIWATLLSVSSLSQVVVADSLRADSSVFFHTLPYYTQGGDSLWLDYYPSADTTGKPTLLFVHGGGFYTGTFRNESITTYCDSLRQWGYPVASMQYTLHLKGQDFHCGQPVANKVRAVEVAVRDMNRAAQFLSAPQDSVITPAQGIVLIGSSAGAEAALHAAYWKPDRPFLKESPAPQDSLGYKAVISFAGALEDTTLIQRTNVIPTMLFHGSCDPLVPLETDIHHYCPKITPGAWLLHGSSSIAEQLERLNSSYYLHVTCGEGHRMAGRPMVEQIAETILFIRTTVEQGAKQQTRIIVPAVTPCDKYPYRECGQ